MDPLSIAASAAGLVGACVKISATLYTFIDDTRNVDTNITSLCDEVLGLSRVLDAISKSWRQSPLLAVAQADPDGKLWASVKASIDDCQKTLQKMEQELGDTQKESRFVRGFMRKPAKSIKLNMKMKDIQIFRQQVQSYTSGMQSALQMINVCLLIHGQSSQDLVMRGLRDLKSQIDRVEANIQNQNSTDISLGDSQDNQRIAQSLERLIRAAESLHSSASTVAGGSSVWDGSIMGDPLSQEQCRIIEDWIPQAVEEEQAADQPSGGTAITFPSTDLLSNPATHSTDILTATASSRNDSDSDSDIEADLRRKFEDLALEKFEQRDYVSAELFLRKIVENKDKKAYSDRFAMIMINIAATCCFQGRWEEAESISIPIAMGKGHVDINAFHMLHTLAIYKMESDNSEDALRWCKRAVWGKKKLLGKVDGSYYESMALLAYVFDKQGERMEAEACRSFIPSNTNLDLDPLSYLRKTLAGNTFLATEPSDNDKDTIASGGRSKLPMVTTPPQKTPPLLASEPAKSSLGSRLFGTRATTRLPTSPAMYSEESQIRRGSQVAVEQDMVARQPQQGPLAVPGQTGHYISPSTDTAASSRPSSVTRSTSTRIRKPRLVVCVDVGLVFTGVAYVLETAGSTGINFETLTAWPPLFGDNKARIPTVLYYDASQKLVGWGPDMSNALAMTGYLREGVKKQEWFLPRLLPASASFYITSAQLPPLPEGKTVTDVVADYLWHVRGIIQSDLQRKYGPVFARNRHHLEWCFTLPQYADEKYAEAYRTAIEKAGYGENHDSGKFTTMKTLEAAIIFLAFSERIHPRPSMSLKDQAILCVKCGGGTTDLTVYQVRDFNYQNLHELGTSSGDYCGATAFNRNFSNAVKAKIKKLPKELDLFGAVYAKNIMDFENRIKPEFRNNGCKWVVDLEIEDDYPEADIEEGCMVWTNDEILKCFTPIVDRIIELIWNGIASVDLYATTLTRIVMFGGLSANEYLYEQVKQRVPPHLQNNVVRPSDILNAAAKGTILAKITQTKKTTRLYVMESTEPFRVGVDPEHYRQWGLDGQDRCLHSWITVIDSGTGFKANEGVSFPMEKLIKPNEKLLFEDTIYTCEKMPPSKPKSLIPRDVAEVIGKITTDLTRLNPKVELKTFQGPYGPYYKIQYDVNFYLANETELAVTSEFNGEVVGSCKMPIQ